MDLSQDIALAYILLENWIPKDFIESVSRQKGLSQGGEDFKIIQEAIIKQSKVHKKRFERLSEEWENIN